MMGEQAVPAPRAFEREDELASALVACDARAWRQLFEEQYDRVYAYAYVRTGNTADADDIASVTFTEAVKGIRRFDYRGTAIAAWLFRIAHHETVDLLKRRKRTQTDALDEADGRQARGEDAIAQAGQRQDIAEAMTQLNDDQRAVVMLRIVEGCSVAEAPPTLGKSEGAVKVTQMRALRKLRRVMEGCGEGEHDIGRR